MKDREKVIKGLEICTSRPCYCTDCPYKKEYCLDSQNVMEDALALLKRQVPRVLTLEEVRNYCSDFVYLETASGWIECCIKDEGMSNKFVGYFVCGFGECFIEEWNEHGKTWRCWSYRPTDEQREAVKWE